MKILRRKQNSRLYLRLDEEKYEAYRGEQQKDIC